jgi:hypothetical protein
MRVSEWIDLAVFTFLTALAWKRRLPERKRWIVTAFGMAAIATTLAGARWGAEIVRDWVPAPLLLMVYWQAGQFFTGANERIQERLLALDRRVVTPVVAWLARSGAGRALLTAVEFAYLFCYPMVPVALGAVYLLHARAQADRFWTIVLISTYACYLMVPFLQTMPPRSLAGAARTAPPRTGVRSFNLWILKHASIQMNTFPSAHVAASMACALAILKISGPVGTGFLVLAIGIALGAVYGRYHYAADAILGAAIAGVVAAAW